MHGSLFYGEELLSEIGVVDFSHYAVDPQATSHASLIYFERRTYGICVARPISIESVEA